jgi:hypothetical protein
VQCLVAEFKLLYIATSINLLELHTKFCDGVMLLGTVCKSSEAVMPAKAGIQFSTDLSGTFKHWIPAFAGMTDFCKPSLDGSRAGEPLSPGFLIGTQRYFAKFSENQQ